MPVSVLVCIFSVCNVIPHFVGNKISWVYAMPYPSFLNPVLTFDPLIRIAVCVYIQGRFNWSRTAVCLFVLCVPLYSSAINCKRVHIFMVDRHVMWISCWLFYWKWSSIDRDSIVIHLIFFSSSLYSCSI